MPLDAECAAFVQAVHDAGVRWDDDTDPVEATVAWGAAIMLGTGGPEPVDRVADLDADGVPVRVFSPDAAGALPLVLSFHGGGFAIGSIESHDPLARRIANATPAVVVSVGYRHGPRDRFPSAHDDAWTALRWCSKHAEALGADAARIALVGDSAGGGLAAYLAVRARDEGEPRLRLQMLWLPLVDHRYDQASCAEFAEGFVLTLEALEWFRSCYLDDPDIDDWRASPARRTDLEGVAPAFVATAECDPLRDQGEEYARTLRDAGVPVEAHRYDGAYHPFYGMTEMLEVARRLDADAIDALRKALV